MYKELKKTCLEANLGLPRLGLVIYTFGNVSIADYSRGVFAIKPTGVPYQAMRSQDIAILDFDGNLVDAPLPPSSDFRIHAALYRNFKGVGAIVHTHSPYAVAWAQALRDVPVYGTTHAEQLPVPIPCTKPLVPGEDAANAAGQAIVDLLAERHLDPARTPMVLAGGHGPFTWGRDAAKALFNARLLEEICKMALLTERINPEICQLKSAKKQKDLL